MKSDMTDKECIERVFGGLFASPKDAKTHPVSPENKKILLEYARKKITGVKPPADSING